MTDVLHLCTPDNEKPLCGTTEGGKLRGFTTNLSMAYEEDFLDPLYNRECRRCLKCCARLGQHVEYRPYKPERHFKIPFAKRHEAKKAGMWWSPETKTWFFPASRSHYHTPGWAEKCWVFNREGPLVVGKVVE
tara:strand:+ start:290 stop:688 length:399 start_codon:yes stop_codon:yes gene_type:complete